jgi:hypothetical protein
VKLLFGAILGHLLFECFWEIIFMKSLSIILLTFILSASSFAAIVKSADKEKNCTLYQVVAADENGNIPLEDNQTIALSHDVYGMSFQNMEIDFDKRNVKVDAIANIILGFNKLLVPNKVALSPKNDQFNFLINQLNRKLLVFEKVCISKQNEVIYANYFEAKEDNPTPSTNSVE